MATTVSKIYYRQQQYVKAYRGDTLEYDTPSFDGLVIKNEYAGTNTFTITKNGSPNAVTLDYTTDNGLNIYSWSSSSGDLSVQIPEGGVLKIRSHSSNNLSKGTTAYYKLTCSKNYSIEDDITYLLNKNGNVQTLPQYAFYGLFISSTTLIDARNAFIPSTTVNKDGCAYMFSSCSNLTGAPEIFATMNISSSNQNRYYQFISMFRSCKKLNYIKVHFTGSWDNSTYSMTDEWTAFGVNNTGTFYKKSGLGSTKNTSGNPAKSSGSTNASSYAIPYGWTVVNF